jgi:hypothetical protein
MAMFDDTTIVITSQSRELLAICRSFLPTWLRIHVLDGTGRLFGMRAIQFAIEQIDARRTVLLDEDAFVFAPSGLLSLIEWSSAAGSACVGMPDGGVVQPRTFNPNAMNPFFNILDLQQVRDRWNEDECRACRGTGTSMTHLWAPDDVISPDVPYAFCDVEAYYCFYFWLRQVGLRMDWLSAHTHTDGMSTVLSDRQKQPFLLHTWYARRFGRDRAETRRITAAALWAARLGQS